jgi:hypothetical protein
MEQGIGGVVGLHARVSDPQITGGIVIGPSGMPAHVPPVTGGADTENERPVVPVPQVGLGAFTVPQLVVSWPIAQGAPPQDDVLG